MKINNRTPVIVMLFITAWFSSGTILFLTRNPVEATDWKIDKLAKDSPCRSQAIVVDAFHKVSCDHPDHRIYLEPLAAFLEKKGKDDMVTENHWIARCVCTNQLREEMELSTCDQEEHEAVQDARRLVGELRELQHRETKEKK